MTSSAAAKETTSSRAAQESTPWTAALATTPSSRTDKSNTRPGRAPSAGPSRQLEKSTEHWRARSRSRLTAGKPLCAASACEKQAEGPCVVVESVVPTRLHDRGRRFADVEDEMPDFEENRALTRHLDADEVSRNVDQERLGLVDEAREVVVASKGLAVGREREDAVDMGDQRPVGFRDRRKSENVASVNREAAVPAVHRRGPAGRGHGRLSGSCGGEHAHQKCCARQEKDEAAHRGSPLLSGRESSRTRRRVRAGQSPRGAARARCNRR